MTKDMQSFIRICNRHEFEIELIQPWHVRVSYFGEDVFDFFPKNKRLFNLREKNLKKAWHTLNYSFWRKLIYRLLETYLFTNMIYVDIKEVSTEEKIMRIIKSTNI